MWRGEAKKKQVNDPGDRLLLYKGRACADDGDDVGGDKNNNGDKDGDCNEKDEGVNVP